MVEVHHPLGQRLSQTSQATGRDAVCSAPLSLEALVFRACVLQHGAAAAAADCQQTHTNRGVLFQTQLL
jgi:hypothetical protein